jgi:hypothetical protein
MEPDPLELLTTRELQAYGVLCLRRFCRSKHIRHPSIDELIEHLLEFCVSTNFSEWEQAGAKIVLSNRGFDLPEELDWKIKEGMHQDVCDLLTRATDIGFTDVYGASTRKPLGHLRSCLAILARHGVARPAIEEIVPGPRATGIELPAFGEPWSRARLKEARAVVGLPPRRRRIRA